MITKNTYEMPYPSAVPTTDEEMQSYVETLAAWLAEKLGLVVRSDLAVMHPDYAAYCYVTFLAPDAESDPYLAVYNNNYANYKYVQYAISPVKKVNNYFRPINIYGGYSSYTFFNKQGSNLAMNITGLGTSEKSVLVVVDFNDGRKIGCFRGVNVASGNLTSQSADYAGSIYLGKIIMQGHEENTCVVCAGGMNSAWLDDYEQCASATEVTATPLLGNKYENSGNAGIIPSNTAGKEFMLKNNYYIGTEAYIKDLIQYSDCGGTIVGGSVLTINNKKYACLARYGTYTARLLMPEYIDD